MIELDIELEWLIFNICYDVELILRRKRLLEKYLTEKYLTEKYLTEKYLTEKYLTENITIIYKEFK
jgi:hypothetical protein